LRRNNPIIAGILADFRKRLASFYSDIGRSSIDPELMVRMLTVGCCPIRSERRLCEEIKLGRFRESDILRHVFERVVAACMAAGLVKGEGLRWMRRRGQLVLDVMREWSTQPAPRSPNRMPLSLYRNCNGKAPASVVPDRR
jgi:hypothetical protein